MKHYTELTYRQLRNQVRRSMLTLFSIMLSVALLSSASVISSSIYQTQINRAVELTGNFDGTLKGLTREQLALLKSMPGIEALGYSLPLGGEREGNISLTLEGFDEEARDLLHLSIKEGRFPEAAGEIALENWLWEQMDPRPVLGESFFKAYFQANVPLSTKGTAEKSGSTFTLVGILESIPAAQASSVSLGLVTPETAEILTPAAQIRFNAFVRLDTGQADPRASFPELASALGLSDKQYSVNEHLLNVKSGAQEAQAPFLLLSGLVLLAAVATIYNVFQISVVERLRLFGTLRALGATSAQIRMLVIGEALLLCGLAIPLGWGLGIGAAGVLSRTLTILKSVIGEINIPVSALAGSAGVGLAATLLSALIPAWYAGRISPLAAIRGSSKVIKGIPPGFRLGKTLIQRTIGFSGWLAYQNLWRSPGRSLVTIFSLSFGVTLFIVFNAYAVNMDASSIAEHFLRGDYALVSNDMGLDTGYPEETLKSILRIPGVEQAIPTRLNNMTYSLLPFEKVDSEIRMRLEGLPNYEDMYESMGEPGFLIGSSQLFGYGESELALLENYLIEGELFIPGQKSLLLVDAQGKYGLKPGDRIKLKTFHRQGEKVNPHEEFFLIAGILSDLPVSLGYGTVGPRLIVQEQEFKDFTRSSSYQRFDLKVAGKQSSEKLEAELKMISQLVNGGSLLSYRELLLNFEREKRDLLLLVYGLACVIAVIGLVNITNTLTTHLITRTREYGMLRAVGMTNDQLAVMTRLEGFFYGILSAVSGESLGVVLGLVLLKMMQTQGDLVGQQFPWLAALLCGAVSIAVAILATFFPTRRLLKLQVIDSLRYIE